MLHAKAKEDPKRRFHALADKVWRKDFLKEAWDRVRRNGGTAGVDKESFKDIEAQGVESWLGELARDLREGTYEPKAVRQVLIPKKQPGSCGRWAFPAFGTGWRRVRGCWCWSRSLKRTCNRNSMAIDRGGVLKTRSAECTGSCRGARGGGRWRSVQLLW